LINIFTDSDSVTSNNLIEIIFKYELQLVALTQMNHYRLNYHCVYGLYIRIQCVL